MRKFEQFFTSLLIYLLSRHGKHVELKQGDLKALGWKSSKKLLHEGWSCLFLILNMNRIKPSSGVIKNSLMSCTRKLFGGGLHSTFLGHYYS